MKNQHNPYIYWLHDVDENDIPEVGGKNASLGEILQHLSPLGIKVPMGFLTTTLAYYNYLESNRLKEPIKNYLKEYHDGKLSVEDSGRAIRKLFINGIFPIHIAESIRNAYAVLCSEYNTDNVDVAVRSSITVRDFPSANFIGLQESFLNVRGEEELLKACRRCYAALFTPRAIVYREEKGLDHFDVGLSIGIQKMIRADHASSGVIYTIDPETGFPDVVVINGTWGLGENIVRGIVNPDQFVVFKPLIDRDDVVPILENKLGSKELKIVYASDDDGRVKNIHTTPEERAGYVLDDTEIMTLARWAKRIEEHYGCPMDIEWVKDEQTGELYIVQVRSETMDALFKKDKRFTNYILDENKGQVLLTGLSIGNSIISGRVKKVESSDDLSSITENDILVTQMTEPDWFPSLKQAAGIITNSGGRTCHAAIVSRELGISAVVGTQVGTTVLKEGQEITLSCSEGEEGKIYDGLLDFDVQETNLADLPELNTDIMVNLAFPESAFKWWWLPVKGVGLARMEFIISHHIKVHPMALIHFERVMRQSERKKIRMITRDYESKTDYFVEELARGISKIAASQYPRPVILRTSDFKTNEYAGLIGGKMFEQIEQNPILGWRGACRYYSKGYREAFALECMAIKKVREEIGLDNVIVMIPFCRTIDEAKMVLRMMAAHGLKRGEHGLQIYMMCETPSNVILAEDFARYFDGFSIGSNDLTQLILGVDRDSEGLSYLFDEDNPAVKKAIRRVIEKGHSAGIKVSFCGQAPSDDPAYAAFLVKSGIDSISLNPDSVVSVIESIARIEKKLPTNV